MKRVIVYIDGFNLYFGMREAHLKRYFWLDLVALSSAFLKPDQTLEHVNYFTARIRRTPSNGPDVLRQGTYLDALAGLDRLSIHEGHYLVKRKTCLECGATWTSYEEKMSDVNLGVQVVLDACDDRFDTAILVSGDSDLTTPVRKVRERFTNKRVLIAFPPKRVSEDLRGAAHGWFHIGEDKFRSSQLPDPVMTASGVSLARPSTWR